MPDSVNVDRRSFIASLGGQTIRSIGAAVGLGETLRREVIDQLRDEPEDMGPAAFSERPALFELPVQPAPDVACLPPWVAGPGPSTWLVPGGRLMAVDQRALPNREAVVACSSVGEVVTLLRSRAIDGGVATTQAALQTLALAADRSGTAPYLSVLAVVEGAARALAAARPDVRLIRAAMDGALASAATAQDAGQLVEQLATQADRFAGAIRREHALLAGRAVAWWATTFPPRARIIVLGEMEPARTGTAGTLAAVIRAAAAAGQLAEILVPEGDPSSDADRQAISSFPGLALAPRKVPDVRIAGWLANGAVDGVLIGGAWGTQQGDIAAGAGALATALLAAEVRVPVHAIVSRSMLVEAAPTIPGSSTTRLDSSAPPPLDLVPSRLLTQVLTDGGSYRPTELAIALLAGGAPSG